MMMTDDLSSHWPLFNPLHLKGLYPYWTVILRNKRHVSLTNAISLYLSSVLSFTLWLISIKDLHLFVWLISKYGRVTVELGVAAGKVDMVCVLKI